MAMQDGRSVQTLTLRALKHYENQLGLFQLFHPFAIILNDEQNFHRSIPAYFARKRIAQMR
jgi:hypothetical protein